MRCSRAMLRAIGLLLLAQYATAPPARAETTVAGLSARLRVATAPIAPFVLPNIDPPSGFSIDLWTEVARQVHVDFTWQRVPRADLVAAVERG